LALTLIITVNLHCLAQGLTQTIRPPENSRC